MWMDESDMHFILPIILSNLTDSFYGTVITIIREFLSEGKQVDCWKKILEEITHKIGINID